MFLCHKVFHVRENRVEPGTIMFSAGLFLCGLYYWRHVGRHLAFTAMAESKFFAAGSSESESSASEDEQPVVAKQTTISTK